MGEKPGYGLPRGPIASWCNCVENRGSKRRGTLVFGVDPPCAGLAEILRADSGGPWDEFERGDVGRPNDGEIATVKSVDRVDVEAFSDSGPRATTLFQRSTGTVEASFERWVPSSSTQALRSLERRIPSSELNVGVDQQLS